MIKYPEMIINVDREVETADLRLRFFIKGEGFLYLGLFVSISKFVETKRFFWIFIFGGLFTVIIFHLTRQSIFFSFLIALCYLLRNNKRLWFYLSLAVILLLGISKGITFEKDSMIGNLVTFTEKQIDDHQSGNENTRITEYRYFFTEYSKNIFTVILGNGIPLTLKTDIQLMSAFGKREKQLQDSHLYISDVGYAQLFVWFGSLSLFLYLLLFYRVMKQKVPIKYMYAKLFFVFVLFTTVMSDSILKNQIEISICLFILEYCNLKEKNEIEYSHHYIEL
jgi:hypothetical protein